MSLAPSIPSIKVKVGRVAPPASYRACRSFAVIRSSTGEGPRRPSAPPLSPPPPMPPKTPALSTPPSLSQPPTPVKPAAPAPTPPPETRPAASVAAAPPPVGGVVTFETGGYGIEPRWVVRRRTYEHTQGHAPTYLLYVDHRHSDVVLAVRGMDMAKESDYVVLLDNRIGQRRFDGGYVHNGLLNAAEWVFDAECDVMRDLLERNPGYTLTFAGHSLGSGVVAMLALVAVHNRERLGGVDRNRIRCFAMAPPRCMSLNLAVRYADVINAVILQDDFLPRTDIPLEDIIKSLFCLPCLLCGNCLIDTCIPESVMLRDPRRLYAPGRLYHIVERKPFRCGRYPPAVRTAVPVDGRFEHIVLSRNAISDHAIIWIEREAQKAIDLMLENERTMKAPENQRMDAETTLARDHGEEHQAALRRAAALGIADVNLPSTYGTFSENTTLEPDEGYPVLSESGRHRTLWDEWIARIFEKDESGEMVPRR